MQTGTPLRSLPFELAERCRVLGTSGVAYRDGSEARVLEVLRAASDLSSSSDELIAQAASWPERYHLDPARAHVLRPLRWDPGARVLEIGAGCGAVTRYLGERAALVDALEPMAERARCARERTRDLPGVEVFVGTPDDVPASPAYDLVVVIGVLEYVGGGTDDHRPYLDFLSRAAAVLRPGGSLVLAIENRLGVKYLCGAPEDHSGRPFESVEGYGKGGPALTFSRRRLEELVRRVGLTPTTFGAFPDYKVTRAVFADELIDRYPRLATGIPRFPSPDWSGGGTRVANEAQVWAGLVDAGLGRDTPNSLVVTGHRGDGPSPLWPDDLLGAYYPGSGYRMACATETTIRRGAPGPRFTRRLLVGSPPDGAPGSGPRARPEDADLVEGEPLLVLMAATSGDEQLGALLRRWQEAFDADAGRGRAAFDLLPHNALVEATGAIVFVDAKWDVPGVGRDDIMGRAALETGQRLAGLTSPQRWSAETLEDLVRHVGAMVGLQGRDWLERAVATEADFQAGIYLGEGGLAPEQRAAAIRAGIDARLSQPLAALAGGAGAGEETPAAARARADATAAALAEADRQLAQRQAEIDAILGTRTFRYSSSARRLYARLRARLAAGR